MLNNFLNEGRTCDRETFLNNGKTQIKGINKSKVEKRKMRPKSSFDFVDDSAVSVSNSGRKMLRIKSICQKSSHLSQRAKGNPEL